MKARPERLRSDGMFEACDPSEATYLRMEFPLGGDAVMLRSRLIPVVLKNPKRKGVLPQPESSGPCWLWNGDTEKPTLSPSVRTRITGGDGEVQQLCHSFVTDGLVEFLGDCTHELAGMTLPLLDITC